MDSTMLWIVHNAMNKADEKMKSKEGVLERLNEISRFYELAALQLEGCLKFVRQETNSYILESSHEQLLSDLTEIRDRLQFRLKESEMAIKEKDRELASLRASHHHKPPRSMSDPLEEYMVSNRMSGESEFSELKQSVDQQVWHLRQQLEPEYKFEGNAQVVEGLKNKKIEQMDSDIWVLKETLDLAFGKMQKAILGSEVGPMEQQWRGGVESDTMSIVLEEFMRDFEEDVEEQVWKKHEKRVCLGLKEYWSEFMNEAEKLRRDLMPLAAQNEVPECSSTNEKSSAEDSGHGKFEKRWSSNGEELIEESHDDEKKEEEGHFVSKMIKNHESIIQKKSAEAEELNVLKREILRHKANLSSRKEGDTFVRKRMQEVILGVEKLRDRDAKLQETFGNFNKFVHGQETPMEKRSPKSDANVSEHDTMSEVWEKMDKVPRGVNSELQNEARMLMQEHEESNLENVMMEEIYVTILEVFVKEKCIELYDNELENLLWRDICQLLYTKEINQWNEKNESNSLDSQIREELYSTIYYRVFSEALKDYGSSMNIALAESFSLRAENIFEASVREDIRLILWHETIKEWNIWKEGYETACLFRQEIDWFVFHETIQDLVSSASYNAAQRDDIVAGDMLHNTESFVREDIYMNFFRETIKEWNMELSAFIMESLIRDEIFQFVIAEAAKDAFSLLEEEADSGNGKKLSEGIVFANKLHDDRQASIADENVNEMIESLVNCSEAEDDMGHIESSESKEPRLDLDLGSMEFEAESTKIGDHVKVYNELTPAFGSVHYEKRCHCQPKAHKEVLLKRVDEFSEDLITFEHTTKEKLQTNFSRLDTMKHHLDNLVEPTSTLRKKESLYRDAFSRRCQDLSKAETEVDLLADQVDVLVALLEKIYTTLYHHSPVLKQYFEVSDILQLINKELPGVTDACKA